MIIIQDFVPALISLIIGLHYVLVLNGMELPLVSSLAAFLPYILVLCAGFLVYDSVAGQK